MTSLAWRIEDAIRDRLRAEPAEHDGMDRADARAGQHGDGRFGHHRQINDHAVAFFDPVSLEHIGEQADFAMKLLVGERAFLARLCRRRPVRLPK